ncbi:MAG: hypothetical protein EZS28_009035 [Streblomastix strix]|uniref:Uncharacterized protein n=1 Tax=Streblomastix strix TaxID=222440 RepID=A0A5J4WKK1_9EUKA|nr:MAG: hypothetical protein EZS28_009035 [Streblomastix strix]
MFRYYFSPIVKQSKKEVKSICALGLFVAVFLGIVNASSNSSVASNKKSKLLALSYNQKKYQSVIFIDVSGKFLPQVVNYIFQQHEFSKQVVHLASLGNNNTKSVT